MRNLSEYRAFFFDCDGVILDSNAIKSDAFADALNHEGSDLVAEFIDYHKTYGGVSRYIKFEHFYKNIKGLTDYEIELSNALKSYAALSYKGLLTAPEISGVRDILRILSKADKLCFVVSGGDEKEVNNVLAEKGLAPFFNKIYGSPATKIQNMDSAIESSISNGPFLYFGDAKSDYDAAMHHDADFIYLYGKSEWAEGQQFCQTHNVDMYQSFTDFLQVVRL